MTKREQKRIIRELCQGMFHTADRCCDGCIAHQALQDRGFMA